MTAQQLVDIETVLAMMRLAREILDTQDKPGVEDLDALALVARVLKIPLRVGEVGESTSFRVFFPVPFFHVRGKESGRA